MFKSFTQSIDQFVLERNWDQYHTLKNIIASHVCEVAELLEAVLSGDKVEAEKELGDCFSTLFCVYRIAGIDIDQCITWKTPEKEAYNHLSEKLNRELDLHFLTQYLSIQSAFLQETFLWIKDEDTIEYIKEVPIDLFITPFIITLACCHLLGKDSLTVMNNKLEQTQKKYRVGEKDSKEALRKMNLEKSLKRSCQC